jgi:hypothetical protein
VVSLITGIIGVATAVTIVVLIRRDHLHVRYGLWWIGAALAFALLGLFPTIIDWIAGRLGIGYPPVLALTIGLTVILLKILVMDIERSRNAIKMQRLVQRVALLEAELSRVESGQTQAGQSVAFEAAQQSITAGDP